MTGRFAENPAYRQYEQLLIQLHSLIAEGKSESDEADQIRDDMDSPWKHLNAQERSRLRGLSADLYMLEDDEVLETPAVAHSQQELYEQIKECNRRGDWEAILDLLRRRPKTVPDGLIAFTRSRVYNALGHVEVALLFFDYAKKYKPDDPNLVPLHLMLLRDAGHAAEAIEAARRYTQDPAASPSVLIVAADIYFNFIEKNDAPSLQRVLDLLGIALSKVSPQSPTDLSQIEFAYILAARCLMLLGLREESVTALDEAMKLQPDDMALKTLRENLAGAATDMDPRAAFDRAVESRRTHDLKGEGPTATAAHPVWGRAA